MSEFRLSLEAEGELDDIWIHVARESGNMDVATHVVESIAERSWLGIRTLDVGAMICPPAYAVFQLTITSSSTVSQKTKWC